MAIGYVVGGAVLCITISGIPFGLQSIKLASLALAPFGKKIVLSRDVGEFVAVAPA
jgi:uncharacterized membrane protein YccF (DUF307 family)